MKCDMCIWKGGKKMAAEEQLKSARKKKHKEKERQLKSKLNGLETTKRESLIKYTPLANEDVYTPTLYIMLQMYVYVWGIYNLCLLTEEASREVTAE